MNETYDDVMVKANIMGGMNEYIKTLGDDDIYDKWIEVFPDECDEETLMEMAEDNEIFYHVTAVFNRLIREI